MNSTSTTDAAKRACGATASTTAKRHLKRRDFAPRGTRHQARCVARPLPGPRVRAGAEPTFHVELAMHHEHGSEQRVRVPRGTCGTHLHGCAMAPRHPPESQAAHARAPLHPLRCAAAAFHVEQAMRRGHEARHAQPPCSRGYSPPHEPVRSSAREHAPSPRLPRSCGPHVPRGTELALRRASHRHGVHSLRASTFHVERWGHHAWVRRVLHRGRTLTPSCSTTNGIAHRQATPVQRGDALLLPPCSTWNGKGIALGFAMPFITAARSRLLAPPRTASRISRSLQFGTSTTTRSRLFLFHVEPQGGHATAGHAGSARGRARAHASCQFHVEPLEAPLIGEPHQFDATPCSRLFLFHVKPREASRIGEPQRFSAAANAPSPCSTWNGGEERHAWVHRVRSSRLRVRDSVLRRKR